jgi:hypothetical protein
VAGVIPVVVSYGGHCGEMPGEAIRKIINRNLVRGSRGIAGRPAEVVIADFSDFNVRMDGMIVSRIDIGSEGKDPYVAVIPLHPALDRAGRVLKLIAELSDRFINKTGMIEILYGVSRAPRDPA